MRVLPSIACLGAIGFVAWLFASPGGAEPTRLTFLAVGQGDCAVFQHAGNTILIDAGPNTNEFDAGEKIVAPKLRQMGIDKIDLILLSHPDSDHTGGLGALLRKFPVGKIGISAGFARHEGMLAQLRAYNAMERVLWLTPSQSATLGEFRVEIACPPVRSGDKDNDGSEFVRISGAGLSAVFTGDAGVETETFMAARGDWSSQILKLGHHGSRTSTSDLWLDEVKPRWAIVSCGRNNSYGHPNGDVLARVQAHGARIARTDQEGDITFTLGPDGWVRE